MAKYKIIPSSRTIVQSPISIGHKAEKGVEAIEFDLTAWVETYGSGTLTVVMRRWGDAIPYPIALEIDENNKATWTLSDIDTAKAGMAYAQLSYIVGDEVVKKSDIYTFRVMDSLTGEGEPPEAYESWLEHLTHLAAEAMAEVLDIEGIVTDKTLTVDGGIADGKATGDALALKADKSTTYTKTEVDQMIGDVEVETDTTLSVSGAPADSAETGRQIGLLKADLGDLSIPLNLVATYQGKQARATGLTDSATNTVYQFEIPDNCETVHITSYFFGNSRIIFTNSATPINFTTVQYQQYPSTGYNNPTDIDDDYATLRFKYVYVTFLVTEGKECKASCSALDIINFIGSNTPIAENRTGAISDFNNAKRNHIYVISSGISNISNYPPISNGGTLLCFAAYDIDNVQLFISNQSAVFFRRLWGATWGGWKQIPTADNVQNVVDTAVDTAFSGYYPYNILSAFKNITCIGDSLTYSQVYTGNSTSRQAYKPYPKVIADRAGATETILATPGDTATQAWDRNSENIVQKDAQLTLVYLGTNGGLTDTMDTDMVGDDYTQWADTNTGAYGKIIAKSIAVGSRVVLIKVHSSSGGVAVTNTVIEKMATRFNVPVINNTYLSGTKYHSWPNGGGTNGTHYNDFGYAVFSDQIANSISQLSAEDVVKIIPI